MQQKLKTRQARDADETPAAPEPRRNRTDNEWNAASRKYNPGDERKRACHIRRTAHSRVATIAVKHEAVHQEPYAAHEWDQSHQACRSCCCNL